jgi:hypothetical protein
MLYSTLQSLNVCAVIPSGHPKTDAIQFHADLFYIGSQAIEFVEKWPHLGHIITNKCDDADDILDNKLNFIEQANKVIYNFRTVDSASKTKLFNAYCSSFTAQSFGICLIMISRPSA